MDRTYNRQEEMVEDKWRNIGIGQNKVIRLQSDIWILLGRSIISSGTHVF